MVNGAKLINNIGKATEKHKIMKIKNSQTNVSRTVDVRQQIY